MVGRKEYRKEEKLHYLGKEIKEERKYFSFVAFGMRRRKEGRPKSSILLIGGQSGRKRKILVV